MIRAKQVVYAKYIVKSSVLIRTFDVMLSYAYYSAFGVEPETTEGDEWAYEPELYSTINKCYGLFIKKPFDINVHEKMTELMLACQDMDYSRIEEVKGLTMMFDVVA